MTAWLVVIGLILVVMVIGSAVAIARAVRRAAEQASQAAADRMRAAGVVPLHLEAATCLGHSLAGVPALRGAGVLALTRDSLRFQLAMPDRVVDVERAGIARVEVTARRRGRRPLGAPKGPSLAVTRDDGTAIEFALAEPQRWVALISPPVDRPPMR